MNILMISPVHPDTPHISAVRAWQFAKGLAALGHKVVLMTAPLRERSPTSCGALTTHDWQQPYIVEVLDDAQTDISLPSPLQKLRTGLRLIVNGGARGGWVRAVVIAAQSNSSAFHPDVVWCTFGALEAAFAAKRIANKLACPWVLDIKDNWELFVPHGLRRLMVWRTSGWAMVTTNADFTKQKAMQWQHTSGKIIYSGVDDAFFQYQGTATKAQFELTITLVGSLYSNEYLTVLMMGIDKWAHSLSENQRGQLVIRYLGGDIRLFNDAAKQCIPNLHVEALGYVSTSDMARYCSQSLLNMYVRHAGTFHHKLLELLACARPIVVYPAETQESRQLTEDAGGELIEASTADAIAVQIARVQNEVVDLSSSARSQHPQKHYTWANQSQLLEQVLLETVNTKQAI